MTVAGRYRSHAKPAGAVAVGCLAIVASTSVLTGQDLTFVVDALFVLATVLFAIAVLLTRPSVSRRRTLQEESPDDAASADRTTGLDRSQICDPPVQLRTGIRLALAALAVLCTSVLIQYAAV